MKLAIVLGTRPEIVKMSPIVRACVRRGVDFFIVHTGQHYSPELDKKIWSDLDLPEPKYNLKIGSHPYAEQVGIMTREIMHALKKEKPDVVIVQGDTTSVLAGALATKRLDIFLAHHESGIRSGDLRMLEETNRIVANHLSDYLFAPTREAAKNLEREGKDPSKINVTGHPIVDAVNENIKLAEEKSHILKTLNVEPRHYTVVTIHRSENVDSNEVLERIMTGLTRAQEYSSMPMIFPMHPRTRSKVEEFHLAIPQTIRVIEPLGFLDFLQIESKAKLIFTDSGGVQEESFILHVPCITLRENTERPETVHHGVNVLAGSDPQTILEKTKHFFTTECPWPQDNLFGEGNAGETILTILIERLERQKRLKRYYNLAAPYRGAKTILKRIF